MAGLAEQAGQVAFGNVGPPGPERDQGTAEPRCRIVGIFVKQPFVIGQCPSPSKWAELALTRVRFSRAFRARSPAAFAASTFA